MTAVHSAQASNGAGALASSRQQLLDQARASAAALSERRAVLVAELAEIDGELKAFHRAAAALDPTPPEPRPDDAKTPARVRANPSRIGPERMAMIERVVRELANADPNGEVAQVDVRKQLGLGSSVMTNAFKQLRDANVIRFARVERLGRGAGTKRYKLTRPALREDEPDQAPVRQAKTGTRQRVLDAFRALDGPVTYAAIKEQSGVSDVAVRNAIRALEAEGVLRGGLADQRADGKTYGKRPRTYVLAAAEVANA